MHNKYILPTPLLAGHWDQPESESQLHCQHSSSSSLVKSDQKLRYWTEPLLQANLQVVFGPPDPSRMHGSRNALLHTTSWLTGADVQTASIRGRMSTREKQLYPEGDRITSNSPAGLHIPAAKPHGLTARLQGAPSTEKAQPSPTLSQTT